MTGKPGRYRRFIPGGTWIFGVVTLCSFLPFLILPFFNHPSGDDYFYETLFRELGFAGAQKKLYTEWIGRFTVTFIQLCFVKFNLVSEHYFVHTFTLFLLTFTAGWFALVKTNRYLLNNAYSKATLAKASSVFLLLNVYIYDDVTSGFYWFSGAVTYQVPVIISLVLAGRMVERINSVQRKNDFSPDVINATLLVLLAGCNETIAISSAMILLYGVIASYHFKRNYKNVLLIYFVVSVLSGFAIMLTSGILDRQRIMASGSNYLIVLPIILFRVVTVLYNIFKEPLFWVCGFIIFFAGVKHRPSRTVPYPAQRIALTGLCALLLLLISILTPLMLLTKGTLPPRALNNIIVIASIFLFILFFITGTGSDVFHLRTMHSTVPNFLLCVTLWSSTCYVSAWRSVFSGYFYDQVMSERKTKVLIANSNDVRTVTFPPYDQAILEKINERFPKGTFSTLKEVFTQSPEIILFENKGEIIPSEMYKKFHNLDTIRFSK